MEKQYYISNEQYQTLLAAWKKLSADKKITSTDILIYNILRSKSPSRGFSKKNSNIQGNDPWFSFALAKWNASLLYNGGYSEETKEKRKQAFFERFGIERPSDFPGKIQESNHE